MHEEQRKLEREARSLALRLDAVLKDKFTARTNFDADTPIDKTLKFLQEVIAVSVYSCDANVTLPSFQCAHTQHFDVNAAKHSTAQHQKAQHSKAQHSAAQRSSAKRSSAQHTVAWHNMHSRHSWTWVAR